MTCEEARVLTAKEPDAATNAEIVAFCNHLDRCRSCRVWLYNDTQTGPIPDVPPEIQARVDRAYADPEAV